MALFVLPVGIVRVRGEEKVAPRSERAAKLPFKSVLEVAPVSALVLLSTDYA